jgi:hypothetical protein
VIYHGHRSLDHLFSDFPSGHIDFIYNVGATRQSVTLPQSLEWALATGTTPATRAVPFITLSEEYTELEWMAVVEYLGVPYDPASDTPAAKPHAYQRYLRRGHGAPWTDDFREIILEMGNETWHNGAGGHGWHGFSRPGYVWFGGAEYGLFARHYFEDHVMQMPAWTEHDLGQKIHFSLNAGYDGAPDAYGELAAQHAPNATHSIGHANYVGPTWETGDTPHEFFDDHGMQETLVGMHTGMKDLIDEVAATRDSLAASGLADYEVVAYEGGPSGYALPGDPSVTPDQVANAELYGKSLGMGVAALDAWLYSSLNGYTHQCFLGFASGGHWTSHTMPRAGGFRRHAGWLALMLRNRWAPGTEMLDTTLTSVPTYDRSGEDVPLITAYTVKGRDTDFGVRSVPQAGRRPRRGRFRRRHDAGDHPAAVLRLHRTDPGRAHRAGRHASRPADQQHHHRERRHRRRVAEPGAVLGHVHRRPDHRRRRRRHATGHGLPLRLRTLRADLLRRL